MKIKKTKLVGRYMMNFIFGVIVGVGITLFACNPSMLGDALHWAGDLVVSQEAKDFVGPSVQGN